MNEYKHTVRFHSTSSPALACVAPQYLAQAAGLWSSAAASTGLKMKPSPASSLVQAYGPSKSGTYSVEKQALFMCS